MFASFLPQIWLKVTTPSQNRRGIFPQKNGQDPVADRWSQVNVFVYFWDTRVAWIKRGSEISQMTKVYISYPFLDETWKTLRRIVHYLSSFITCIDHFPVVDPFPSEESCFFSVSDCRRVNGTHMNCDHHPFCGWRPRKRPVRFHANPVDGAWGWVRVLWLVVRWLRRRSTSLVPIRWDGEREGWKLRDSWLAGWPHSVGKPWKASAINLPSTVIVYSSTHKHGDLGDGLLLALLHWQKKRSIFRWGSNWPRAAEPKIRWGSSKSRLASPLGRRVCRWFVDRLGTRMPWRGWRSAPIFWCGKRVGMP